MFNTKVVVYRIYTEAVNIEWIKKLLDKSFSGYIFYYGKGVWEKNTEKNLTIEIVCSVMRSKLINRISKSIKKHNKQQAILITKSEAFADLV